MPNGDMTTGDVQTASSPGGLQQFLARLGYNVSDPVDQTAASLGIAERVQHQILRARRVAAQREAPGVPPALEVYAFEVIALTADLRKAVVSSFRDKPANVLLILTTRDYDPLDFVLAQKSLRQSRGPGGQVAVSHQLLSVDRRNPSRVHLRVLERMRNKAADPYVQFDRLFDLTLDEQKLILSRVGPGRPLPPRRGRRKKPGGREAKADPWLFAQDAE